MAFVLSVGIGAFSAGTVGTVMVNIGLIKFDTTCEHDTNLTRFWWVWIEYNRVWVISVLTRLIRLINGSYSC